MDDLGDALKAAGGSEHLQNALDAAKGSPTELRDAIEAANGTDASEVLTFTCNECDALYPSPLVMSRKLFDLFQSADAETKTITCPKGHTATYKPSNFSISKS